MKAISKKAVRKAGEFLRGDDHTDSVRTKLAFDALAAWRSAHAVHLNNFNSWIRGKVGRLYDNPIIAQRLKRFESIVAKLMANPDMQLDRMQDIAGMRVVLESIGDTYDLFHRVCAASGDRELVRSKDYIDAPKPDGYRSIHLVFKCRSQSNPDVDDLMVELQIRTRLQHIWSTAYETLGTVLHTVFKRGEGEEPYRAYFRVVSALFSLEEGQPVLEGCKEMSKAELIEDLRILEEELRVIQLLRSAALTADCIEANNYADAAYHVVELDSDARVANIYAYTAKQLNAAESFYAMREFETRDDPAFSVVLVSVGDVKELRRAYPNYFMDTQSFINRIERLLGTRESS